MLNTCLLLAVLPKDKCGPWIIEVRSLRTNRVTTYAKLDSLVGKLNHVAFVIPLARHFLTCLRNLVDRNKPQHQQIAVSKHVDRECELWEAFLFKAS
jgi:hypothetical protein